MAGHFENHVHTEIASLLHHNRTGIFFRRIEDVIGLHLARDFASMLVHFDGKYAGCAGGPGHGNRKQPDWSASRDGHGFGGDLARQHRVNRIAQRIENRRVFLWNGGVEFPDIRFRNDHVLGEGAVGIHADNSHVLADVSFAGAALQALAARYVHFSGYEVAFLDAGDFVTERRNFTAEFVTWNQRRMNAVLRPTVPVIDMQVGAADGCDLYFNQNVVAPEAGDFDFPDLRARRSLRLYDGKHGGRHEGYLMNSASDTKRLILAPWEGCRFD